MEKTIPYHDPKTGTTKYRSEYTKNEYFIVMLAVAHRQVKYKYILADSWFSSAENCNYITGTLKKHYIMAIEKSRTAALSQQNRLAGKFHSVDTIAELENNECLLVYLKSIESRVLLTKQVFTNKDGREGTLYLISSDTALSYEQILTIYQKRWKVEEYHKSLKQNT